jgi:hypothetical protein
VVTNVGVGLLVTLLKIGSCVRTGIVAGRFVVTTVGGCVIALPVGVMREPVGLLVSVLEDGTCAIGIVVIEQSTVATVGGKVLSRFGPCVTGFAVAIGTSVVVCGEVLISFGSLVGKRTGAMTFTISGVVGSVLALESITGRNEAGTCVLGSIGDSVIE